MKSPPTSAFIMIQTKRSFQLLVVPLNPPSKLGKSDQLLRRSVRRHRGQPKFSRFGFAFWPFGNQPFEIPRFVPVLIPMSRSNSQKEKPGSHLSAGSFSPANVLPQVLRCVLCQVQNRCRLSTGTTPDSRWRTAFPRPLLGRKRFHARRPYCGFAADSNNIGNLTFRQRISESSDIAISCIRQHGCRRQLIGAHTVNHIQCNLPLGLKFNRLGHTCGSSPFWSPLPRLQADTIDTPPARSRLHWQCERLTAT